MHHFTKARSFSISEVAKLGDFLLSGRDAVTEINSRNEEGYSVIPYLQNYDEPALEAMKDQCNQIISYLEAMKFYDDCCETTDVMIMMRNRSRALKEVAALKRFLSRYEPSISQTGDNDL